MSKWIKLLMRLAASLPVIIGAGASHASTPKGPDTRPTQFNAQNSGEQELASLFVAPSNEAPVVHVASRFKEPGDKGRPDIFGSPGKPVIGPPGKSGY
jgi:hypothetical protein